MIRSAKDWEWESRFFLPNEDAQVARAALAALPAKPARPAFVCGSGMLLLDVLADCPGAQAVAVDISSWQISFFRKLRDALRTMACTAELRAWFVAGVYPRLREYYLRRGQYYAPDAVMSAIQDRFGLRFFTDEKVFGTVKEHCGTVGTVHGDMADWLVRRAADYDFVHLSNIVDYLPPAVLPGMFSACRERRAAVLLIRTSACAHDGLPRAAWREAGYAVHPVSAELDRMNRALGAPRAEKPWMRTGETVLLV